MHLPCPGDPLHPLTHRLAQSNHSLLLFPNQPTHHTHLNREGEANNNPSPIKKLQALQNHHLLLLINPPDPPTHPPTYPLPQTGRMKRTTSRLRPKPPGPARCRKLHLQVRPTHPPTHLTSYLPLKYSTTHTNPLLSYPPTHLFIYHPPTYLFITEHHTPTTHPPTHPLTSPGPRWSPRTPPLGPHSLSSRSGDEHRGRGRGRGREKH